MNEIDAQLVALAESPEWKAFGITRLEEEWRAFVLEGSYQFGGTVCRYGTVYEIAGVAVPVLLAIAKEDHRARAVSVYCLSRILYASRGGPLRSDFANDIVLRDAHGNPHPRWAPKPTAADVRREDEWLQELRDMIEAEIDTWLALSRHEDEELRTYAAFLLSAYRWHERTDEARARAAELLPTIDEYYGQDVDEMRHRLERDLDEVHWYDDAEELAEDEDEDDWDDDDWDEDDEEEE